MSCTVASNWLQKFWNFNTSPQNLGSSILGSLRLDDWWLSLCRLPLEDCSSELQSLFKYSWVHLKLDQAHPRNPSNSIVHSQFPRLQVDLSTEHMPRDALTIFRSTLIEVISCSCLAFAVGGSSLLNNIQTTIPAFWLGKSMSINPKSVQKCEIECKKVQFSDWQLLLWARTNKMEDKN